MEVQQIICCHKNRIQQLFCHTCTFIHVPFTTDMRIILFIKWPSCLTSVIFIQLKIRQISNICHWPVRYMYRVHVVLQFFLFIGHIIFTQNYIFSRLLFSILSINWHYLLGTCIVVTLKFKHWISKNQSISVTLTFNRETMSVLNSCFFFYSRH